GFDPLRDVERILIAAGPSSYPPEGKQPAGADLSNFGPLLLVQGRFDPAKLQAKAEQVAKDMPQMVKNQASGKYKLVEITLSSEKVFVAVLDQSTVAVSPSKAQALTALDKVAHQKKPSFKSQAVQKFLQNLDPKHSVAAFALGEAVVGTGMSKTFGPNADNETKVSHERLRDMGITALEADLTIGDAIKGKVFITTQDAERAKQMTAMIQEGLTRAEDEVKKVATQKKKSPPRIAAPKWIKPPAKDKTMTLEGQGSAEALVAVVKGFFYFVSSEAPARPPAAVKP